MEKQCSNKDCREIKPLSEFSKCKKNKDGKNTICKKCGVIKTRESKEKG